VTIDLVAEAVQAGARREVACEALGLSARTVERWQAGATEDQRRGPVTAPANKLTDEERREILDTVNERRFRERSSNQIVPRLGDDLVKVRRIDRGGRDRGGWGEGRWGA
jgi:putative transposase